MTRRRGAGDGRPAGRIRIAGAAPGRPRRSGERLGIFGGTFDPPHLGHLALAEWARVRLRLDRVLFVPAGLPPHKRRAPLSGAVARLAMTRLAVRGHRAFVVAAHEVRVPAPSYTCDTVLRFAARWPKSRLFLLIGADSLDEFRSWRDPEGILARATLAVAARPGSGKPAARAWARRRGAVWIGNPGLEVSSSMIRARARAGASLKYLVPDAVARYIARHRLYRKVR